MMDLSILKDMLTVLGLTVLPYIGYLHRRISIMSKIMTQKVAKEELHEYVDLKIMPEKVKVEDMKEDIKEIKQDLKQLMRQLGCSN